MSIHLLSHDILKTSTPILMPIGINHPRGKCMEGSTFAGRAVKHQGQR